MLVRRFVPGSGEHTGYPWGNNRARTLVYGAAAPRVASLTLSGAGAPRRLVVDPHGGVFLAVLDGHVDPRSLTLTARLRDGRTISYRRSTNLLEPSYTPVEGPASKTSRPLHEPPVPAYRNPLPAKQALPAPPDVPLPSTVRETLRAKDPAGGPEWALRSWQGLPNPRANFGDGYHPTRMLCTQVGVVRHGRLVEPRPYSAPLTLSVGQEYGASVGGCNEPKDLARFGPLAETVSYVADPYAYAPRPLRTVVSGLLGLDATHPVLLGAGAPRPLALDANHAFLAVLPGRYWDAPLRISATIDGRTVGARAVQEGRPGPGVPATPQSRAPDPDGGAPWGFAAGRNGSRAYGRIIEGRFATIDAQSGALRYGLQGSSSGGGAPLKRRPAPVRFETEGGPEYNLSGELTNALPPPEIERRTLPGRTIVTGTAEADVVSITLATPRDVRTLRPSGPEHTFIVVYDGQFFRGALTATVELRDGHTVTEPVPNGPGGNIGLVGRTPSLAARLRSDEVTLRGMRSRVARAERANPRQRKQLLGDAPLARIVQGLQGIQAIVATEQARAAYVQAHPGILSGE